MILITLFSFLYLLTKMKKKKKKKTLFPSPCLSLPSQKEQWDFWPEMLGCYGP